MAMIKVMLTAVLLAAGLAACVFQEPGVYRGGKLIRPEPLDIKEFNSFRFVEKWRISHRWLTGPPEIWPCGYSGNPFADKHPSSILANETDSPIFEKDGKLFTVGMRVRNGNLYAYSVSDQKIYGTNREGKFIGYSSFCGHAFMDSYDGIGLYIVKPDPAKGTDEWIKGAEPVVINGLKWLRKIEPLRDWSKSEKQLAAPIETWVLKIPDTDYWLKLHLSSNSGATSSLNRGALHHPEKHARIVELFHELVRSVKLEPIEPVDISELLDEASKKKDQKK